MTHPPKLNPEQLAEQLHALAFDALDRGAYATAAIFCSALREMDALLAVRALERDVKQHDQDSAPRTVEVPLIGATRPEYPRHGHVAVVYEGETCSVCGTTGVRECGGCLRDVPGSVRHDGGRCGQCGTVWFGCHEETGAKLQRDVARSAAAAVAWTEGARRGRAEQGTDRAVPTETLPAVPDGADPLEYCERCCGYRSYAHECDKPTPDPY